MGGGGYYRTVARRLNVLLLIQPECTACQSRAYLIHTEFKTIYAGIGKGCPKKKLFQNYFEYLEAAW